MRAIKTIENSQPDIAHRIRQLLESDLKTNGISTIQKFDPEKFNYLKLIYSNQTVMFVLFTNPS